MLSLILAVNLILPMTGQRERIIQPETLFHTLFADFFSERDGTTYVQTGDIPAMWLRDSSAQTLPYVRFISVNPILAMRFAGVIERNARNVLKDPYANAFSAKYSVWERKWEADSLSWPVLLTWVYWQRTGLRNIFTPTLHAALRKTVDTWRCEQLHSQCSRYTWSGRAPDSQPFNAQTGMIWTAFRPSDDPVHYHFNIPAEAQIVIALQDIARLAAIGYEDHNLANEANSMAAQVEVGIERYGRVWNPAYGGWVYVYETDGFGNYSYLDDANFPNLTSLPYMGYCAADDPTYLNTRTFALSARNPWYFSGKYASGLGSPHTPSGYVWPLGIMARALTATSSAETDEAVTVLAETDSEQGLIHESFDANAYWIFTRAEFGWANALYAVLIFRSVAGFTTVPLTASDRAVLPNEELSKTPTLTPMLVQIQDTGLLYRALGDLLERADGRTTIAPIRRLLKRSAKPRNDGPAP
jgi:meiotically up-regulated gene 157 (Mug157) protein